MKRELLDLIYPPRCPVCDRVLAMADREAGVCRKCAPRLPWIRGPYCLKCGKPLADGRKEYCASCMRREHLYIQGRSVFRYEKELRASVLRMKFHNRRDYLDFYAKAMCAYAGLFLERIRPCSLITVPMHPGKVRERGFDQCLLLGEKLSALSGIPMYAEAVMRKRYTQPQKGLGPEERKRNLEAAFAAGRLGPVREPVLLMDDIYTTGTTVDAVCSVLNREGLEEVYVLTLCMSAGGEELSGGTVEEDGKNVIFSPKLVNIFS